MFDLIDDQPEFLVIYKKAGANFHTEAGELGLFETVKQTLQLDTLFPVHRLDKVTSGLLLLAKSEAANVQFNGQFLARSIEKYYLAISEKKPNKKQGTICGDMVPARRGSWMLTKALTNPALTQFFSKGLGDGKRLFIIKPHTGKTHQIRVALKSVGAPILGDIYYADASAAKQLDRTYLHAYSLAFEFNGTPYRYTAMPREGEFFLNANFAAAMAEYQTPWALPWPSVRGKLA